MYFGERNYSFGRKPDPEKEQLVEQNALLRRLLKQQTQNFEESRKLHEQSRSRRRLILTFSGLGLFIILISGIYAFRQSFSERHNAQNPLAGFSSSTDFPLYYPSALPANYSFEKGSAKLQAGVLFYTLQNGRNDVTISEQQTPSSVPDFTKLPGFSTIETPAGSAVSGTLQQKPIAIISGSTTLINITGSKLLSSNDINTIARSMTTVSR